MPPQAQVLAFPGGAPRSVTQWGPRHPGETLHLGCGRDLLADCFNVDRVLLQGVDLAVDLDVLPWPFASHSWDRIKMFHVAEHLKDRIGTFREIHRILKPGGVCEMKVPHVSSSDAWDDPTHIQFFTRKSFRYLDRKSPMNYYFDFGFQSCEATNHFGTGLPGRINGLMNPIVNNQLYDYALWKLIPCAEIRVTLVK